MFHVDPGRVKVFVRVRPATEDELGKYGSVPYELQSEKKQVNDLLMLELTPDMRHCLPPRWFGVMTVLCNNTAGKKNFP